MEGLVGDGQALFASVAGFRSSRITQRDSFDDANAEPQRVISSKSHALCHV